ncbi:elongation factor Ts [bacterium]|nr:elongation factor Ts [bacterium]
MSLATSTFTPVELSIEGMLDHGLHLGHLSRYWNPKMKEYIFKVRYGVHIINLVKTERCFRRALSFIEKIVSKGGKILFVGTKSTASDIVAEQANRCQMPYVNHRWLGGMLTNFKTVKLSINRLSKLQEMKEQGILEKLTKKEALMKSREIEKLEKTLGGIKKLSRLPDALFVVDVGYEDIAIKEANKLGIPVIGIVDTNNSPDGIQYMIPANDDAIRAISYSLSLAAQLIEETRTRHSEAQKQDVRQLARDTHKKAKDKKEEVSTTKEHTPQEAEVAAPIADVAQVTISAASVKQLREITGAGMMECKKALVEAQGDFEKAQEFLIQSGQKKVAKSAARIAAEGVIEIVQHDNFIGLVEINCETDFVARDATFQGLRSLVKKAIVSRPATLETLLALEVDGATLEQHVQQAITKIGEKVTIRRAQFEDFEAGKVGFYNHSGKMAALVTLDKADETLARDLAMHIAAMNPQYLSSADVPHDVLNAQKQIFVEELTEEEKASKAKDKIVKGRLEKHFSAQSLLDQAFIKNPDLTIAALLEQAHATILKFIRFEVGEGIEKQHVDFAQEVMQQAKR